MDANNSCDIALESLLGHLIELNKLVIPSKERSTELLGLMKCLFDSSNIYSSKTIGPIKELYVEAIDEESVWEELQSRNRPLIRFLNNSRSKLNKFQVEVATPQVEDDAESSPEEEEEEEGDSIDEEENDGTEVKEKDNDVEQENSPDDDMMEQWLDDMDEANYNEDEEDDSEADQGDNSDRENEDLEEHSEEEEEDYQESENIPRTKKDLKFVQKQLYDGTDSEEDENSVGYRYEDFFVSGGKQQDSKKRVGVGADGEGEEYSEGFSEEEGGNENEEVQGEDQMSKPKGSVVKAGKNKTKLMEEIDNLEEELVEPRSWDLRGEVGATNRPENSLLEVEAHVERSSKSAPAVTQQFTSSLEEMIRLRVKEGKFDDVQPTTAVIEDDEVETEHQELSQEKSSKGLGDLYAEEFLSKSLKHNSSSSRLDTTKSEALVIFRSLTRELDALSHFYFTPKAPAPPEALVKAESISTLQLEDIAATGNFSNVDTRAPEEVFEKPRGKNRSFKSENELTAAERRKLKKRERSLTEDGSKKKKKVSKDITSKDRRLVVPEEGYQKSTGGDFSSSALFFANMQKQEN